MGCCEPKLKEDDLLSKQLALNEQKPYLEDTSLQPLEQLKQEPLFLQSPHESQIRINRANFIQRIQGKITDYYQILQKIGQGTNSKIFRAIHKQTCSARAIKTIQKSKLSESKAENMFKQVQILKSLDHPNILKIFQVIQQADQINIVTELCSGGELFGIVAQKEYLSQNLASCYMFQIISAIAYCHLNGVVHRDLKPQNILLDTPSHNSMLKIIDFGISKKVSIQKSMTRFIGSAYYVAPEVIKGEYDQKCDVWSCGVILYILLSGTPPFNGNSQAEILKKVSRGIYSFQGANWGNISVQAKKIIRDMLTKDPKRRPSANEIYNHPWIQQKQQLFLDDNILTNKTLESLTHFRGFCKIRQATFSYIATQLVTQSEISELRKVFLRIDRNGDGRISANQLRKGFSAADISIMMDIEEIIENVDLDGNGYIEYTEFLTSTLNWQKILTQERVEAAFRAYDVDRKGRLTVEDIKSFIGDKSIDDQA